MRIYSKVLDAVKEIERDLFEMGIQNHAPTVQDLDVRNNEEYDSTELIGYSYMVQSDFRDVDDIIPFLFQEKEVSENIIFYCMRELVERMYVLNEDSDCFVLNPGTSWKYRKEYWETFLHKGKFSYTYPERMFSQFNRVFAELERNRYSRQCVVTIYDRHKDLINLGGKERIPCSMYYQFLIRNIAGQDKLKVIYTMRSCDFYSHFAIDVWLGINMGLSLARRLYIPMESFTHFIGSLHAFKKDYSKRRIF